MDGDRSSRSSTTARGMSIAATDHKVIGAQQQQR
jgi:hypothetical protein